MVLLKRPYLIEKIILFWIVPMAVKILLWEAVIILISVVDASPCGLLPSLLNQRRNESFVISHSLNILLLI